MNKVSLAVLIVVASVLAIDAYRFYRNARVNGLEPCWSKSVNLGTAKEQWARETLATSGMPGTIEIIVPYLVDMPTCHVAGTTYIIDKVGEEPRCTVHETVSNFVPERY